jgi:hypothetical protein
MNRREFTLLTMAGLGLKAKRNTEIPKPLYSDDEVITFVRTCNNHQAPITFNVGIYQDGTMASASVEQLQRLGANLKV